MLAFLRPGQLTTLRLATMASLAALPIPVPFVTKEEN
jgi:hypothetical protein